MLYWIQRIPVTGAVQCMCSQGRGLSNPDRTCPVLHLQRLYRSWQRKQRDSLLAWFTLIKTGFVCKRVVRSILFTSLPTMR